MPAAAEHFAAQVVQVRFIVVVPSDDTYWPALQVVLLAQAVAGLASWSQLPVAHAIAAAVPPAQ